MTIRRAEKADIGRIGELLLEVARLHAEGRPDLFKGGARKYSDGELEAILKNESTPVFLATEEGRILGYLFAERRESEESALLRAGRTLYIDDLCVDPSARGLHVGTRLYEHAREVAREWGCNSVTLNVWALNEGALAFYRALGMSPLKTVMEERL